MKKKKRNRNNQRIKEIKYRGIIKRKKNNPPNNKKYHFQFSVLLRPNSRAMDVRW